MTMLLKVPFRHKPTPECDLGFAHHQCSYIADRERDLNKSTADHLPAPPPQLSRWSHLSRALGMHQRWLARIVVASAM